jgi:hypothetical protein
VEEEEKEKGKEKEKEKKENNNNNKSVGKSNNEIPFLSHRQSLLGACNPGVTTALL